VPSWFAVLQLTNGWILPQCTARARLPAPLCGWLHAGGPGRKKTGSAEPVFRGSYRVQ
jgi:hypothetical protein